MTRYCIKCVVQRKHWSHKNTPSYIHHPHGQIMGFRFLSLWKMDRQYNGSRHTSYSTSCKMGLRLCMTLLRVSHTKRSKWIGWMNLPVPVRFASLNKWSLGYMHYSDVIMGAIASQISRLTIVSSTVCLDVDQKHQSSASLAFVVGIHRWPVISPVTRKMFPFDDVIEVAISKA